MRDDAHLTAITAWPQPLNKPTKLACAGHNSLPGPVFKTMHFKGLPAGIRRITQPGMEIIHSAYPVAAVEIISVNKYNDWRLNCLFEERS
jgi:hypothetical protein